MIKNNLKSLNIITEKYKDTNITKNDISNYGIIYTPFYLVEKQLGQIPDIYFQNPHLKWLDTGAGIGNYSIILFKRLYKGLSNVIVDCEERCRHIIEKMIFMNEVFPAHIEHLQYIFGENSNIITKCFLSISLEDYGLFDFIIGNPPYNINGSIKTPTNSKLKKQDDGKTIYVDFVYKSLQLLKSGGFLNYIIPNIWLKPDKAGLYNCLTNLKIHYITSLTTNDTQKCFKYQAQTPTCYFLIENIQDINNGHKVIKIWDKFFMEYIDYKLLKDWPIPCHGISILNRLMCFVEKYGYLSPYKSSISKKNVKIDTQESKIYKYKNITTCILDNLAPQIKYNWSDTKCQYSDKSKLILAHKMYGFPYLDIIGDCGISSRDNYIFLEQDYEYINLVDIQKYLSTKFALFIFSTTNYRMRYLEKYAFQFIPDITKIDDFCLDNIVNRFERDKYISNFFHFTEKEREIIEQFSREYNFFIPDL
tara:strand:- start:8050 stop:9480 length:1431 start_codon:yes stop_codon:yes gene_type:complete